MTYILLNIYIPPVLAKITENNQIRSSSGSTEYEWVDERGEKRSGSSSGQRSTLGTYLDHSVVGIYYDEEGYAKARIAWEAYSHEIPRLIQLLEESLAKHEEEDKAKQRKREEEARNALQREREREAAQLEKNRALEQLNRQFNTNFLNARKYWKDRLGSVFIEHEFEQCRAKFTTNWSLDHLALELDEQQAAAVADHGPHLQVTARAGSGKTRTLVARALFQIIHCRIPASSILLLAFNKMAVEEIRQRLGEHLTEEQMPHVLTFHALAYRVVKPQEELIYDEGETKEGQVFSGTIQRIIDSELRGGSLEKALRDLMEARWKEDLDRIIENGYNLPKEQFLEFRGRLPRTTMDGRRVSSEAHKHVGNALLRHRIRYSYRRTLHRQAGTIYTPEFSHYNKDKDSRIIIEFLEESGNEANPARKAFWLSDRSSNSVLIQLAEGDATDGTEVSLRISDGLRTHGIPVSPMSDDEVWEAVMDRAIDDFTKAAKQFISRCQKELITPEKLTSMVNGTAGRGTEIQKQFWRLSAKIFSRYLAVLTEEKKTDFDQLMLRAAEMIMAGQTRFTSSRGSGNLTHIRHVLIDEFQDFSHLFNELRTAFIAQSPDALFFCVGDDWQAINKFAGSDLRYFTGFQDNFRPSSQKLISTNYRSCRRIVEAGNDVMSGEGPPSIPSSKDSGSVCIVHVDPNLSYTEAEEIVVEELGEQAVPILRIASASASRGLEVVVLSRNGSQGTPEGMLKLEAWERKLRQFLPEEHRKLLKVSTTHGYKGKESDVVVLLGPENYPAIHPDAIFNTIFGDTFESNVADEKRLFYVGVTRARSRLFLLYDPESLNPFHNPPATFLRQIRNPTTYDIKSISARLVCGDRVIIRLSNRPGCPINCGTYLLRDRLKSEGYKWSDENKTWSCFLEPGSINSPFECAQYLQRQPWINEADGVVASFAWADQSHRLKIDRGTVAPDFPASSSPSDTQISGGGWRPIPGWTGETTPKPIPAHFAPGTGSEVHHVQVAGVTYENRALAIRSLRVAEVVTLRRQPSNPYDPNAIEVLTLDLRSLGHIPKPLAARLARRFDELGGQLQATVTAMNPGTINGTYLSLSIQFEIPGLDTAQLAVPSPPSASPLPTSADLAARLSPQQILDAVNAELAASVAHPTPEDLAPAQSPCLAPSQQNELADLGDERLRRLITDLYLGGSCPWPTFGYEGMDRGGRCTGSMLEIAWPDFKVGVALPTNDVASFVTNGWMICAAATASERILRAFFTESSETSTSAPQSATPATVKPTGPLDLDQEFENFRNRYPYGATSIDDDDDIPF